MDLAWCCVSSSYRDVVCVVDIANVIVDFLVFWVKIVGYYEESVVVWLRVILLCLNAKYYENEAFQSSHWKPVNFLPRSGGCVWRDFRRRSNDLVEFLGKAPPRIALQHYLFI